MSNIVRKNENAPASTLGGWEPFRTMREWLRRDPFREMEPFFGRSMAAPEELLASFDIKESKDAFTFRVDVPGVKEGDIDISVTGNRLSISGKREAEKTDSTETYYTYERSYGAFSRAFTMPEGSDLDHVRTDLKDGVLTVVVPKRAEVQPKRIAVKSASTTKA